MKTLTESNYERTIRDAEGRLWAHKTEEGKKYYHGVIFTPQGIVQLHSEPAHKNPSHWMIYISYICNKKVYQQSRRVSTHPTMKGLAMIANKYAKLHSEQQQSIIRLVPASDKEIKNFKKASDLRPWYKRIWDWW